MASSEEILVIGNGFDLCHGKKTGYRDFITRVEVAFGKQPDRRTDFDVMLTQLCDVNGFFRHFHFMVPEDLSWTFFENEIGGIVGTLAHFQDVIEQNQRDPEFDLISYNLIAGLFTYRDLQIFKHFARIFEQVIDDPTGGMFKLRQPFITQDKTLNRKALIDEVRRELDDFTSALDLYMTYCVEEESSIVRLPGFGDIRPDYVINFNYTDTVKLYDVPEERIYYAKGKAGSNPADLVLGSPGGADVPAEWMCFTNDFQKLLKFIGLPDRERMHPTDKGGKPVPVTVRYFGYSFPAGDADLLAELWNTAALSVIYYTDREDYAHIMLGLFGLFGKKAVTDAVYQGRLAFEIVENE